MPGAYESEFRVTNLDWDPKLEDKESQEFKQLTAEVESQLGELYPGAQVKVVDFRRGSVVVKFRVVYPEDKGPAPSKEEVERMLRDRLEQGGKFGEFDVDADSVHAGCEETLQVTCISRIMLCFFFHLNSRSRHVRGDRLQRRLVRLRGRRLPLRLPRVHDGGVRRTHVHQH